MPHPTLADMLRQLNETDESTRMEAKRGSEIGKSILETLSSFSNEPGLGGGYLLLGVEKNENALPGLGGYEVTGVSDPEKTEQSLVSACNSQLNERIRPEIWAETIDSKVAVIAYIPEVPAASKPIYGNKNGLPKGAFRRIGSSDVACTDDDLAILFNARGFQPHDSEVVEEAEMDDLDSDAIGTYRRIRHGIKKDASELDLDNVSLLRSLRCIVKHNGEWKPTVAGLLLFGSKLALRRIMPLQRIDYVVVPGRLWGEGIEEAITSIELRESLITMLPRIERLIGGDLPRTTVLPTEGISAHSAPVLPDRVLREALVNAAMHRDYRITSPVQVIRYANRLEIRNPGYSLKAVEQLAEPGSQPRNPAIAEVLHELDFAETKGSGIRRMMNLMAKANLSRPVFDSDRSAQYFSATLFTHNFMSEEDLAWLADFSDCSFSNEEITAVSLVREIGFLTNQMLRFSTGLDTLNASKKLKRLRGMGIISQVGAGNATYYQPGPRLLQSSEDVSSQGQNLLVSEVEVLTPEQDEVMSHVPVDAIETQGHNPLADAEGHNLAVDGVETQGHNSETQPQHGSANSEDLDFASAHWLEVEREILELTSGTPLRADEIADRMKRSRNRLQRSYLTPMVRRGSLALSHPERLNHPDQRYIAVDDASNSAKLPL